MSKRYFPIHTETACQLKWNWSTLYLNSGTTASCHRTASSVLTPENFNNFHNTPVKIQDREDMLAGKWPEKNCSYCKNIEDLGGFSDRQLHLGIPGLVPSELVENPTATTVTPTILEIYFSNTCNLKCIYCKPAFSSRINDEFINHGPIELKTWEVAPIESQLASLVDKLWIWLEEHLHELKRIHVLGGEVFVQKELDTLLDLIERVGAPNCEFGMVSNLNIPTPRLEGYVKRIKKLVAQKKLKRVEVTASVDCWGEEQEYVRYGFKSELFEKNFELLLAEKWLKLNINQVVSSLTIKTMPELIKKLNKWRETRWVGHFFSSPEPGPHFLRTDVFGPGVFDQDFAKVLELMHRDTEEAESGYQYMKGISIEAATNPRNDIMVNDLIVYLTELDLRRGTDWKSIFPWLKELV